jgi:MFS family permease
MKHRKPKFAWLPDGTGSRGRLFRRNPVFARFWIARAASLAGDGIATTALLLFIGARNGPADVAPVMLMSAVPRFFGPVAGALADRWPVRPLLIGCEIVQGGLWAAVAIWLPGLAVLSVLVLVAAAAATVTATASRSILVRTLPARDLSRANAWMGMAFNLRVVVGPLAGGLMIQFTGARAAFAVNVLSFAVGALALAGMSRPPAAAPGGSGMAPFLADVASGLRYARASKFVRSLSLLLLFGVLFGSLDNVALVFLARDSLHAGAAGYGVLATGFGAAMIAGSIWLTRTAERYSQCGIFLGGWALTGLGLAVTGIVPWLAAAVAAQAVAGLGNGMASIGEEFLLLRHVPADMLGKIGGLLASAAFVGTIAAYGIAGLLVAALSPRPVLEIAGLGLLAVTAASTRRIVSADRAGPAAPPPLARPPRPAIPATGRPKEEIR